MSRTARGYGVILGILLLAFALRCVTLDTRPLWYDDAFSVLLAERGPAAIAAGTAADTMPPGYYLLLFGWMNAVGQSPAAMRMLSVGLSLLVVAMVFALARRAFGVNTGNWAALLVAVMPFQIYHAQELRMYTLLALGVVVYAYGVLELVLPKRGGRGARGRDDAGTQRLPTRALGFIALGTAFALYAHNLAIASLLAGNVYVMALAFGRKQSWRKFAYLIAAQAVGLLFFLPWLFYVPAQLGKIQQAFWTAAPGLLDVVQMVLVFLSYLPLPPLLISIALFCAVMLLVLVSRQLVKMARRERLPGLGLVIALAVVPPALLFVLSYLIRPVFVPRGAIASALAFAILSAVVVARAPRVLQVGMVALTLLAAGALLPFYYAAYGEWRRAPFLEANTFLEAQRQNGDVILHDNKLAYFPMHLYDRAAPQRFLADPPQSDNDTLAPASQAAMELYPVPFEQTVSEHARVWFVIYQTALDEANAAGFPHANLARLDENYRRVQETSYGDLRIFLFTSR